LEDVLAAPVDASLVDESKVTRAGIGTYLSGKPKAQRRYAIYFDALARISDDLCKSRGKPRSIVSTV
jgi:hypothetical protein